MKLGVLLAALERVYQTVDKKGETGSASILLDAYKTDKAQVVYLYSTNMVAEVNDKIACEVEEPGRSLIDPDQLRAGLAYRQPDDDVEIALVTSGKGKTEVNRLRVKIGKNQFHLGYDLAGTDVMAKRMKAIPFRQAASYTMAGKAMGECVRRGAFCIPQTGEAQKRFEMSGMRVVVTEAGYEAHATDGHIAARIRVKGEKGLKPMNGVLIPGRALAPLSKLTRKEDEIQVIEGDKKQFYRMGESTFFGTRLLEGKFPDVAAMFAAHAPDYWLRVNRVELHRALQRAGSFVFDGLRQVELEVSADKLIVRAKKQVEDLTEELAVENIDMPEGLVVVRSIALDYLVNIANTSSQEQLKLGVSKNEKLALVVDDADGDVETLYVVMPIPNKVEVPVKAAA
jgi:DNA polymerase III sliding clamp (beta) subunit (PCNA family)